MGKNGYEAFWMCYLSRHETPAIEQRRHLMFRRRIEQVIPVLVFVLLLDLLQVGTVLAAEERSSTTTQSASQTVLDDQEGDSRPVLESLTMGPLQVRVYPATSQSRMPQVAGVIGASTTSEQCTSIHAWRDARTSVLRRIAYRYNHWMTWCWDGSAITEIVEDYDYLSHTDTAFEWRGTASESAAYYRWGGNRRGRYRSFMKGEVANCVVRYGCIGTYYPQITINVYANGRNSVSGSG